MEESQLISANNQLWLRTEITDDNGCLDIHHFKVEKILCDYKTQFQQVLILKTSQFGDMLILDGDIQSAQSDEFIYHESLVHPAMMSHANPSRVLIIGGGEGATLREVLRHPSVQEVVMVDIDGELIDICKKLLPSWHQGSFEDPRVTVLHQDGKIYLNRCEKKFDVIFMGLCDEMEGPIAELYQLEFFQLLKGCLASDGILSVQASCGFSPIFYSTHLKIRSLIKQLFSTTESYSTFVPSFTNDWSFILAHHSTAIGSMSQQSVDSLLHARKITQTLKHYDGITHQRLFSLSKDLRHYLAME